jgi:hypothetical protein
MQVRRHNHDCYFTGQKWPCSPPPAKQKYATGAGGKCLSRIGRVSGASPIRDRKASLPGNSWHASTRLCKLPIVGFLSTGSSPTFARFLEAFHQGLREQGSLMDLTWGELRERHIFSARNRRHDPCISPAIERLRLLHCMSQQLAQGRRSDLGGVVYQETCL